MTIKKLLSALFVSLSLALPAQASKITVSPVIIQNSGVDALQYYNPAINNFLPLTIGTGLTFSSGTLSSTVTGAVWGSITGTLSNQTDLQSALNGKQPLDADLTALAALTGTNTIYYRSAASTWSPVTAGSNVTFSGGTLDSIATDLITAGTNVTITGSGTSGSPYVINSGGSGGAVWGTISGTLSDQTDLQDELDDKQDLNSNLTDISGVSTNGLLTYSTAAGGIVSRTFTTLNPDVVLNNPSGTNGNISLDLAGNLLGLDSTHLSSLGFLTRTGSGTFNLRQLVPGNGIDITNVAGIAGSPTISNTGVLSLNGVAGQGVTINNEPTGALTAQIDTAASLGWTGNEAFLGTYTTFTSNILFTPDDATTTFFDMLPDNNTATPTSQRWFASDYTNYISFHAAPSMDAPVDITWPSQLTPTANDEPGFWVDLGGGLTSFIDLFNRDNTWTANNTYNGRDLNINVGKNVTIQPSGSGVPVNIFPNTSDNAVTPIRFYESASLNYAGLKAPNSVVGSYTMALPTAQCGAGQVMINDGLGQLSCTTPTLGTVSSVAVSGANGIGVSGSPITSTGTIALSLGAITPTSVAASGTVTGSNLSGTNTGNVTLAGENYLSISAGQILTAGAVNLSGTNATGTLAAARMPALTGDITTSAGAVATTLATVNGNVGSFGSATQVGGFTVNAKGLITAASNITITPAVGSITGLGTGVATWLATPSSANLASALTDETGGTGVAVFAGSPTITTPSFTTGFTIGGAAASGKFPVGNGTNYVASTSTIPTSAGATAGKILVSDGTNYVLSTPTFPNASATSGKIIISDGTNWTASSNTVSLGGTLTTGAAFTTSGANALTLTTTGSTNVTMPTTGTLATLAGTETLTNKRVTPRTDTVASSATPTVNTDTTDFFTVTALATNITSMTTNLSGTPTNGQKMMYRFIDNGTARTIAWGASFASRGVTCPVTTVISKYLYVGTIWNGTTMTWDCVASAQEQ